MLEQNRVPGKRWLWKSEVEITSEMELDAEHNTKELPKQSANFVGTYLSLGILTVTLGKGSWKTRQPHRKSPKSF